MKLKSKVSKDGSYRFVKIGNNTVGFWRRPTGNWRPWKLSYRLQQGHGDEYRMGLYEFKTQKRLTKAMYKMVGMLRIGDYRFDSPGARQAMKAYRKTKKAKGGKAKAKTKAEPTKKATHVSGLDVSTLTTKQKKHLLKDLKKALKEKTTEEERLSFL